MALRCEGLVDLPDAVGDVAYEFGLREINGIDDGGGEVDVDDFAFSLAHEKGRLFYHVVSNIENDVGIFHRTAGEVAGGESCVAEKERVGFVDDSFAPLGGDKGDSLLVDEVSELLGGDFAIAASSDDDEGVLCFLKKFDRAGD